MKMESGCLIWEIVRRDNCLLVKEFGRGHASIQFSKERNNVNLYKHSENGAIRQYTFDATITRQLIWEIVRKKGQFRVKEFVRWKVSDQLSKDYSVNSFKWRLSCGARNNKDKKSLGKFAALLHKEFTRIADAVVNQLSTQLSILLSGREVAKEAFFKTWKLTLLNNLMSLNASCMI